MRVFISRLLAMLLLLSTVLTCLIACNKNSDNDSGNKPTEAPATNAPATEAPATDAPTEAPTEEPTEAPTKEPSEDATEAPKHEHIDYVERVKLDMSSDTFKQEVSVKFFIDGDTTHFNVPSSLDKTGVMKARYLAVNTPESTGKIEEWGKAASNFTKEKLSSAVSIIAESDDNSWNYDGNGRYLVWIWYQPAEGAEYRNLNIELLQNGLAVGSSAAEGRYGESAVAAIAQATIEKLYIFSDDLDPSFPYGEATSVTLKELRSNIASYEGTKVSFEGIVTCNSDWTAYVEAYDAETEMYYGVQVFYGYNSTLINPLAQGNRVRIVGVVNSHNGTYQVSGLFYKPMEPDNPANTAKLESGLTPAFTETDAATFVGEKTITVGEEEKTYKYADLAMSTSISMKDLRVVDIYTTTNEASSDKGAMTLTCKVGDITISVRTEVLKDADKNLVTAEYFEGKTIDVKGIVDYYDYENTGNGTYQIRVYSLSDITVH